MDEDAEWNKNKSDQQMGAEGDDSIETLASTVIVSLDWEYIIAHNEIFQKKYDTPSFPYIWLMVSDHRLLMHRSSFQYYILRKSGGNHLSPISALDKGAYNL